LKILISSYVFSPSVGGIETVSALLATEFLKEGHEVALVTATGEEDGIARPYQVYRQPSPAKLIELTRWCDVFFQSNISLRLSWPLVFIKRPWVIVHQTWIGSPLHRNLDPRIPLKRFLLRFGINVAISRAVANDIPVPSVIIGNPYSNIVFRHLDDVPRNNDLVYLGRLVSDKGVDLVVDALVKLREYDLKPHLTIIGGGVEESALRKQSARLGVSDQIHFAGSKAGEELARMLNSYAVLVVPSKLPEPFGIVAIEGIASGCVVVASRAGGLPDVVGPCGVTYEMGDLSAFTQALHTLLVHPELREKLLENADSHLEQFHPHTVANAYLKLFTQAVKGN
jgi:glycogen(starch) synthase